MPKPPSVNFTPIGSKCLLWRIPQVDGPVVLSDSAKETPLECIVLAVSESGLGEYDSKALSLLKTGNRVLIRRNSGTEIKVDGHEVTVIHVMDILGRF